MNNIPELIDIREEVSIMKDMDDLVLHLSISQLEAIADHIESLQAQVKELEQWQRMIMLKMSAEEPPK